MMTNYKQQLSGIKTFIFDVDGVMTSGVVLLTAEGNMLRSVNVKDGYAIQLAVKKGYRIIIISGGSCEAVRRRFSLLGIEEIHLGVAHKQKVFEALKRDGLDPAGALYMGDDIPDYEVMQQVSLPTCPADAAEEIKGISKYISSRRGGEGCVRDVIEQVLKVQGNWLDSDGFRW